MQFLAKYSAYTALGLLFIYILGSAFSHTRKSSSDIFYDSYNDRNSSIENTIQARLKMTKFGLTNMTEHRLQLLEEVRMAKVRELHGLSWIPDETYCTVQEGRTIRDHLSGKEKVQYNNVNNPLCTPHKHRYRYARQPIGDLCESFTSKRKSTRVVMCGDVGMHHLFQALAMLMTGDFKTASMKPGTDKIAPHCTADGQFVAQCREFIRSDMTFCGGKLHVQYLHDGWCYPGLTHLASYDHYVWSGGDHSVLWHKQGEKDRTGIHDPVVIESSILKKIGPDVFPYGRKIIWMDSHARFTGPKKLAVEDSPERIAWFNEKMTKLVTRYCGVKRFIRSHNITDSLIKDLDATGHRTQLNFMSEDEGRHWLRTVNLAKATDLLNELQEPGSVAKNHNLDYFPVAGEP